MSDDLDLSAVTMPLAIAEQYADEITVLIATIGHFGRAGESLLTVPIFDRLEEVVTGVQTAHTTYLDAMGALLTSSYKPVGSWIEPEYAGLIRRGLAVTDVYEDAVAKLDDLLALLLAEEVKGAADD